MYLFFRVQKDHEILIELRGDEKMQEVIEIIQHDFGIDPNTFKIKTTEGEEIDNSMTANALGDQRTLILDYKQSNTDILSNFQIKLPNVTPKNLLNIIPQKELKRPDASGKVPEHVDDLSEKLLELPNDLQNSYNSCSLTEKEAIQRLIQNSSMPISQILSLYFANEKDEMITQSFLNDL